MRHRAFVATLKFLHKSGRYVTNIHELINPPKKTAIIIIAIDKNNP